MAEELNNNSESKRPNPTFWQKVVAGWRQFKDDIQFWKRAESPLLGDPNRGSVDFYPDALEIKHQQLPWLAAHGITVAVIFFTIVIVWACVCEVDIIVVGNGKLTPENDIIMKPLERCVIRSINVKAGDTVTKGQVLFNFDPELAIADAERLLADINLYSATVDRLTAEYNGKEYNPELGKPDTKGDRDKMLQRAIFLQRKGYYAEKMRYYDEYIKRMNASIKTTSDSMKKQEEILKAMKDIENIYASLHEKKIASLKERLQIAINRMQSESALEQLRNQLVEQSHQKETITTEKNSFVEEWRNTISQKLVEARQSLSSTRLQYNKAEQMVSYVELRAPCDATVLDIASFPVGSAVREAEAIITLVPISSALEMEAEVRPQDIGKIQVGADARIKLSAFPYQKHGTLNGKVRTISANTFTKQEGHAGATYYKVRLTISGELRNLENGEPLMAGMEASAEIKTGTRKIIEFVTYPLMRGLDEAFREP